MSARARDRRPSGAGAGAWALPVDAVLVLVFVLVGRRSHDESSALVGVATTLWPFLVGTVAGWLLAVVVRRPWHSLAAGLVVWPATVVVGMGLRVASGQGVQPSFVVVATVALAVALLGWRAVARLVGRRRRDVSASRRPRSARR